MKCLNSKIFFSHVRWRALYIELDPFKGQPTSAFRLDTTVVGGMGRDFLFKVSLLIIEFITLKLKIAIISSTRSFSQFLVVLTYLDYSLNNITLPTTYIQKNMFICTYGYIRSLTHVLHAYTTSILMVKAQKKN